MSASLALLAQSMPSGYSLSYSGNDWTLVGSGNLLVSRDGYRIRFGTERAFRIPSTRTFVNKFLKGLGLGFTLRVLPNGNGTGVYFKPNTYRGRNFRSYRILTLRISSHVDWYMRDSLCGQDLLGGDMVVTIDPAMMDNYGAIQDVVREFDVRTGNAYKITVRNPHGRRVEPLDNITVGNELLVLFWSAPYMPDNTAHTLSVFGAELRGGQRDTVEFLEHQLPANTQVLYDGDTVAAYLCGRTLYIPYDLPHSDGAEARESDVIHTILTPILDWAHATLGGTEIVEEIPLNRLEEVYAKAAMSSFDTAFNTLTTELRNASESLNTAIQRYEGAMTLMASVRARLDGLESKREKIKDETKNGIAAIKKNASVERVTTYGTSSLVVITKPITIETPDAVYDIGAFKIIFGQGRVRVRNMTRKISDLDHPHIRDGVPCYGQTGIMQYVSDGDLSSAVAALIEFLRSYNSGDAYTHVSNWPEIKKIEPEESGSEPQRRTRTRSRTRGADSVVVFSRVLDELGNPIEPDNENDEDSEEDE